MCGAPAGGGEGGALEPTLPGETVVQLPQQQQQQQQQQQLPPPLPPPQRQLQPPRPLVLGGAREMRELLRGGARGGGGADGMGGRGGGAAPLPVASMHQRPVERTPSLRDMAVELAGAVLAAGGGGSANDGTGSGGGGGGGGGGDGELLRMMPQRQAASVGGGGGGADMAAGGDAGTGPAGLGNPGGAGAAAAGLAAALDPAAREDVRALTQRAQNIIPFVLLLAVAFLHQHFVGIGYAAASAGALHLLDAKFREQVALKDGARRGALLALVAGALALALASFRVFHALTPSVARHGGGGGGGGAAEDPSLVPVSCRLVRLMMRPFSCEDPSVFDVLWVVVANDFLLRFATLALKAAIALVPFGGLIRLAGGGGGGGAAQSAVEPSRSVQICNRRKRQTYACVELASTVVRQAVATPPWMQYYQGQNAHSAVSLFFVVLYLTFKLTVMQHSLKLLRDTFLTFWNNELDAGRRATGEEVAEAGAPECPICYEEHMSAPVVLDCGHIFCDECAHEWFERERTCPLCRHPVEPRAGTDVIRPEHLDGGGGMTPQLL